MTAEGQASVRDLNGIIDTRLDSGEVSLNMRASDFKYGPVDIETPKILNRYDSIFDPATLAGVMPLLENPDVQEEDSKSEIRMFDDSGDGFRISTFPEMLSDPFKICVFAAPACVTSISGYARSDRSAEIELVGVDITFKRSDFEDSDTTARTNTPTDTTFNSCNGHGYDKDEYLAYTTALHEAGHAFGLSQFGLIEYLLAPFSDVNYHISHPGTTDAVVNEDPITLVFEPDCSPHPLDILAIYALYQTE